MNLTSFADNAASYRVMERNERESFDTGSAADYFGDRLALVQVGDPQGEDSERGAYDWWPLTINGEAIGELRDDASGLSIHIQM